MNHSERESFVRELARRLATAYVREGGHVSVGEEAKLLGASGHEHPIDIVVDFDELFHLYMVRVGQQGVSPAVVLAYAARIDDISRAKPGVDLYAHLITRRFLATGAAQLAEHYVIDVHCVSSPERFRPKPPRRLTPRSPEMFFTTAD